MHLEALLFLPVLGLAAGVDLYFTLLTLGVVSLIGWGAGPPGAVADLGSVGVMIVTGAFYLAELTAERRLVSSLVWNALHAIIRPLAGVLLALLVLDGAPTSLLLVGALGTALLASLAHATATGGSLLLRLTPSARVRPVLASLLEDTTVLGGVILAFERPAWSAGLALLLVLGALVRTRSNLSAFAFGMQLLWSASRRLVSRRGGWVLGGSLPAWLQEELARHTSVVEHLRGVPGALVGAPRTRPIVRGWLVAGGDGPRFVYGPGRWVDLGPWAPVGLTREPLLRRVSYTRPAGVALYLPLQGPGRPALRDELGLGEATSETSSHGTRSSVHG